MRTTRVHPQPADGSPAPRGYSEGRAWVRVRGAFLPELIDARPGERLRLVFRREETAPCSERVLLPSLGRSVMLPPFEDVAVDLGPLAEGEYEFHCELGVLRGLIRVRERSEHAAVDVVGGRIVIRGRRPRLRGHRGGESRPGPGWRRPASVLRSVGDFERDREEV